MGFFDTTISVFESKTFSKAAVLISFIALCFYMKKYFGTDSTVLILGAAVIIGSCSAFFEGIFIGGLIYLMIPTFFDIKVSAWAVLIIAVVLFFVLKYWSAKLYWIPAGFAAFLYAFVLMGMLIQHKPSPVWYVGIFLVTFTTSMLLHLEARYVIGWKMKSNSHSHSDIEWEE